jgi:hypothetical protein
MACEKRLLFLIPLDWSRAFSLSANPGSLGILAPGIVTLPFAQKNSVNFHPENPGDTPLIFGCPLPSGDDVADHLRHGMKTAGDLRLRDSHREEEGLDQSFFRIIKIGIDFLFHLVYSYSIMNSKGEVQVKYTRSRR